MAELTRCQVYNHADIPLMTSPYLPKGTIFFFNPDVPPDMAFASIEEKLKWMAENGRLTVMVNVGDGDA